MQPDSQSSAQDHHDAVQVTRKGREEICLRGYVGVPKGTTAHRALQDVLGICAHEGVLDATIYSGTGVWKGYPEDTIIIEVLVPAIATHSDDITVGLFRAMLFFIKGYWNQEAVGFTRHTVWTEDV